jgi:hypothetical protein
MKAPASTVTNIFYIIQGVRFFPFFFPNCINCYPLMRTINFGKNLRLSQIQPITTAEFKFMQFGKKKGKTLHPVYHIYYFLFGYNVSLKHLQVLKL